MAHTTYRSSTLTATVAAASAANFRSWLPEVLCRSATSRSATCLAVGRRWGDRCQQSSMRRCTAVGTRPGGNAGRLFSAPTSRAMSRFYAFVTQASTTTQPHGHTSMSRAPWLLLARPHTLVPSNGRLPVKVSHITTPKAYTSTDWSLASQL